MLVNSTNRRFELRLITRQPGRSARRNFCELQIPMTRQGGAWNAGRRLQAS
jgi:hypothetical protein